MELVKGKLKNKDTGSELEFSLNPTDYTLHRSFEFGIEPCMGQSAPVIGFRSGSLSHLSFNLVFDKDADKQCAPASVLSFLKDLNKVDEASRSVGEIQFQLGNFSFIGFILEYTYQPSRFDNEGKPMCVRADFKMISNGEFEDGKH